MATFRHPQLLLDIYGYIQTSMDTFRHIWLNVDIHGQIQISMDTFRLLRLLLEVYIAIVTTLKLLWVHLDICGYIQPVCYIYTYKYIQQFMARGYIITLMFIKYPLLHSLIYIYKYAQLGARIDCNVELAFAASRANKSAKRSSAAKG